MLILRKPEPSDESEIVKCYERSTLLHQPWVYVPKDYGTYLGQEGRYFLCMESSAEIVATFNISGIVRSYFQSAYLGYEVFSPHEGKGYMRVGMQLLLQEAFGVLNLHRLEANVQPGNTASIRLLERTGFTKEGYSKDYLNIGGRGWKDHERWAIVNNDWSLEEKGV